MNEFLKKSVEQIKAMWGGLNAGQRVSLVLLSGLLVVAVVWLVAGSRTDDMVLFVGPEEPIETRSQIKQELDKRNFRYEIRGDAMYVQRKEQDRIRLDLAGSAMFPDSQLYKFLDEPSITQTSAHFEKQWMVAVQRRLSKFIAEIDAVRSAGVQITPPSQRSEMNFAGGSPAKAAVKIDLKPGKKLTSQNVKAIAHVVSGSVKGLDPSGVAIVDTQGRLYQLPKDEEDWGAAMNRIEQEDVSEQKKVQKIRETLSAYVRDTSDLFIAVTAVLNSSKEEVRKKERKNPVDVKSKESSIIENSTMPGHPSTIIQEGAVDITKIAQGGSNKTETHAETAAAVTEIDTFTKKPAGDIEKVSAAVVMRLYKDEKGTPVAIDENTAKQLISKAAGIAPADISFSMLEVPAVPVTPIEPSSMEAMQDFMDRFGGQILTLLLIIVSLFVIWRIVKRAAPVATTIYDQIENERRKAALEVEGIGGGLAQVETEEAKVAGFKKGVKEMVQKNPRGIAGIVKRWTQEK